MHDFLACNFPFRERESYTGNRRLDAKNRLLRQTLPCEHVLLVITRNYLVTNEEIILNNAFEKLRKDGFFLHRISEAAQQNISETIAAAFSFFRLSLEDKQLNRLPEEMGYRPFGIEYSQSPAHPDQIESFSVNPRIVDKLLELPSGAAKVLCNRMLASFDVLESIAETTIIHLANKIGGHAVGRQLHGAFHHRSRLQVNYSRPAETTFSHINEAHEDGDLVTIACASGPGLEIQRFNGRFNGQFTPLTTGSGEVLIMPGEIAWLLSGGQIRPLYHRVRPLANQVERIALLFFGDIDPTLCEPWMLNEINRGVDIKSRVLTSVTRFGLKGFASD